MLDIESKIRSIIVDITGVDEIEITPETNFKNDLGLDSLDMVEVIMEFECEFSIDINTGDIRKMATVADAVAYIENSEKRKNAVESKIS
ncbi:MAG: acyl carrier protein [Flavobacteriales bacterium]|nr:acyl carrier protein [Flavobacteriales bacterium]